MNNTVTLIKNDSSRIPNIKASVQKNKIFIDGDHILIESGDHIEHKMSNGATDVYRVIDPGFHEKFSGMAAHYQIDVEKLGVAERSRFVQHITNYNLSDNARINNSSIDNSTNIIGSKDLQKQILMLRDALETANLNPEQKRSSLEVVEAIQQQAISPKPSKAVVKVLLDALPKIESIAVIATSIAGLLS
ncbi:hypothetical protein AZI87_00900 [Bdellovibrio bacteriovorus]|uniref:Uncharacterized protein n=2 Tax=Bdellovibrio bacteriovorus TaxID=959 RepID=A0A161PVJ8_BDEBC|nr:hypothetical protein AZI87_00900 [Bdellovibrio bacteriovorus]